MTAEPKYKYGQQEQVTVRNHNRSTALERSVLKYWGGGLKPVLRVLSKDFKDCRNMTVIPSPRIWISTTLDKIVHLTEIVSCLLHT